MNNSLIDKYLEGNGGGLIGYFPVAFPVYVIHLEYDCFDSDPFFPLYRALLRYTKLDETHTNIAYFAHAIGFERSLIDKCIKYLKEKGMILSFQNRYAVSHDADSKYLGFNTRPTVRVSSSIIVDGKSLKLLSPVVYQSKRELIERTENVSAHLPVDLSLNISSLQRLKRELGRGEIKEILHLDPSSSNFDITEISKKFLRGAYAVFYTDADGKCCKQILYQGEPIQCDALEPIVTYSIQLTNTERGWIFTPNLGYNVADRDEAKDITVMACPEGIEALLIERYSLPQHSCAKIKMDARTGTPIICIEERLLFQAGNPVEILDDVIRGYIDFPVNSIGIVRITIHHNIHKYVHFWKEVMKWNYEKNENGKAFSRRIQQTYPLWRDYLVKFRQLDVLEMIDVDCFILNK
jgi:hypothetical protein